MLFRKTITYIVAKFLSTYLLFIVFCLLLGMIVVCRYSKRSGHIEWRRAMALKRLNLTEFTIFFIDHGLYATVHYHMLRRLFKAFGQVPLQVKTGLF